MAVDDVYKFNGFATQALNQYMVTLAFQSRLPGDPTAGDLQTLADDIMQVFRPGQAAAVAWTGWTFTQLWGSNMTINQSKCTRSGGKAYAGNFTPPVAGSDPASGDTLPPQCALVTTLQTGFVGRRKRGRVYSFGALEFEQASGTWIPAYVSAYTTRWGVFVNKYGTPAVTGNFRFGVWSERTATGCVPDANGSGHTFVDTPHPELAFTAVSGVTVRPTVFTQRRRTLGVGR